MKALKHKTQNSESVRGKVPTILALSFATPFVVVVVVGPLCFWVLLVCFVVVVLWCKNAVAAANVTVL